jgi:hypothetical protein
MEDFLECDLNPNAEGGKKREDDDDEEDHRHGR